MRNRETAAIEFGEERLDVAQDRPAGGRIADMADGREAFSRSMIAAVGKSVADETEAAFEMEDMAVEGDDARGFLAAMLQGVEAERRDGGGVRMSVDAEDAAFLTQGIAFEVQVDCLGLTCHVSDHADMFISRICAPVRPARTLI